MSAYRKIQDDMEVRGADKAEKGFKAKRHVISSGILECQGNQLPYWVNLHLARRLGRVESPHPMLEDMR
jgi:hypothetical protein